MSITRSLYDRASTYLLLSLGYFIWHLADINVDYASLTRQIFQVYLPIIHDVRFGRHVMAKRVLLLHHAPGNDYTAYADQALELGNRDLM